MDPIERVLHVVKEFYEAVRLPFRPDMTINDIHGDDAEDLIHAGADSIGLAHDVVDRHFPFSTYFERERNLSVEPFLAVRKLLLRLTGRRPPREELTAITAQAFAERIVALKRDFDAGELPP